MAVVGAIAAVVGAGTAVYGADKQRDAAKEQKAAAKDQEIAIAKNVEAERAEVGETLRRTELNQAQLRDLAAAKAASLGLTGGGSTQLYLDELQKVHGEEISWMKRAGASSAEALALEGKYQVAMTKAGAKQSMGSAFGTLGQAANQSANYWK